jgi:hypothetical protein
LVTNGNNAVPSQVKPKLVRSEYGMGSSITSNAQKISEWGGLLQPLLSISTALPSPSTMSGLASWAVPGVKNVELGNELSYGYKLGASKSAGEAYAHIVVAASEVLKPHGVGVLAIAEDGGTGSSAWTDGMFAAVPNLASYVAGWTIHPYWGGTNAKNTDNYGIPKLQRMVATLEKHGDTKVSIYATEWGVPSDNGVKFTSGQDATYAEAGEIISKHPAQLQSAAKGRLACLLLYQAYDQRAPKSGTEREWYFGFLTNTGGNKGEMTAKAEAFFKS